MLSLRHDAKTSRSWRRALATSRRLRNALVVVLAVAILAVVAKCIASFEYTAPQAKLLNGTLTGTQPPNSKGSRRRSAPDFAELDKWYATPPAGENAATVLQEAFALYAKPAPRTHSGRQEDKRESVLRTIGSAKLPPGSESLSDDMKDTITKVLAKTRRHSNSCTRAHP